MASSRVVRSRDEHVAVAYLRVSTVEQAEKELSLPAQQTAIEKFAARRSIRIARTFTDAGASGRTDANRAGLNELLAFLLNAGCDASQILVYQTSRFMRDVTRARVLKQKLSKIGVRVIAITQETSDDPMGHLVDGISEVLDQYESDMNGMRTKACMRQAARQGYWPGGRTPYGFRSRRVEISPNVTRTVLESNPEEAERLQDVCRMVAGGAGATNVGRTMNRTGRYYRNGKPWTKDLVLKVTADTAAIGEVVYGRQTKEPVIVRVEPIVDADLWAQVQHVRTQRRQAQGRSNSSPMLLAGFVKCMRCGASYQLETSGHAVREGQYVYRYYNCRNHCRAGKEVCAGGRIGEKILDEAVLRHLAGVVFQEEHCAELLAAVIDETSVLRSRTEDERRRMRDELDDVERRITGWLLEIEDNKLAFAVAADRIQDLQRRKAELQETLSKVQPLQPIPEVLRDPRRIASFANEVRDAFLGEDRALARGYLRLLVDRIDTDGDAVHITVRGSAMAGAASETETRGQIGSGDSPTCGGDWLRK